MLNNFSMQMFSNLSIDCYTNVAAFHYLIYPSGHLCNVLSYSPRNSVFLSLGIFSRNIYFEYTNWSFNFLKGLLRIFSSLKEKVPNSFQDINALFS